MRHVSSSASIAPGLVVRGVRLQPDRRERVEGTERRGRCPDSPAFALAGYGAAYSGGTAWDSHPLPLSHPGGVS